MASKVLNIEVGRRICKVCVSEKKGKSISISDTFIFFTPDGAVVDGQIVSEITLGDALMSELKERDIKATEVYFSIASTKIASRDVTLPAVKEDQIKNIVSTNASDYFPIDVSKYVLDTLLLEKKEDECHVLVVAVPTAIVESYIALADYTGLVIKNLDFSANSQFQVLKAIGGENVNMFINVDADTTSVVFTEGGKLLMQRSLAFGGDEMICKYMGLKEMPDYEYLKALGLLSTKAGAPAQKETEGETEEEGFDESFGGEVHNEGSYPELQDCLVKLVNSIARSLDFFRNGNYSDKEIGRVILMGACSHLIGIKEQIAETLEYETLWLEEVTDIQGLANSIDDISVYIGCLGSRMAPMSFLPAEYIKKSGNKGKGGLVNGENFGFVAIAAALVVALVLCGYPGINMLLAKRKLEDVEAKIAELQYCEEEFQAYVRYTDGDRELQKFVDGSVSNNANLRAFFEELEKKMPSDLLLLSASCTNESVSMNITVPSFKEAADAIRQLRGFESIDVISVSSLAQSGEDGATAVNFSLNCTYRVEETTIEAPAEETSAEATEEA